MSRHYEVDAWLGPCNDPTCAGGRPQGPFGLALGRMREVARIAIQFDSETNVARVGDREILMGVLMTNWGRAPSGTHTVTSRAIDTHGAIQPAPDDPTITNRRRTYWEANQHITRTIVLL
jgi:hypothetical protein